VVVGAMEAASQMRMEESWKRVAWIARAGQGRRDCSVPADSSRTKPRSGGVACCFMRGRLRRTVGREGFQLAAQCSGSGTVRASGFGPDSTFAAISGACHLVWNVHVPSLVAQPWGWGAARPNLVLQGVLFRAVQTAAE
jgi:hypothetical protein